MRRDNQQLKSSSHRCSSSRSYIRDACRCCVSIYSNEESSRDRRERGLRDEERVSLSLSLRAFRVPSNYLFLLAIVRSILLSVFRSFSSPFPLLSSPRLPRRVFFSRSTIKFTGAPIYSPVSLCALMHYPFVRCCTVSRQLLKCLRSRETFVAMSRCRFQKHTLILLQI